MIADALEQSLQKVVESKMRLPAQKKQVIDAFMGVFTNLRKKPVVDLEQRTALMQKRVEQAVEDMSVHYVRGELVIKVAGSAGLLLTEFRRGSDWFAPEPDVDKIILAAMLVEPKRS
jgi:phosphopantetheine adenylyltransferase